MSNERVLVVDDDPIYLRSSRAVLESRGYHVDTAQDGSKALALMEQEKPDLVILDVMMDWLLEGVSISQEMMSRGELQGIPIIMVTSIRSSEYMGMFPQDQYLHINSWLDKPCSPDQLLAEVGDALARHKEQQKRSP